MVMPADEPDRVAAAIGEVTGVETKVDPFRVGVFEKRRHLVFVFHMRVGVRVKDKPESKPVRQVGGFVRRLNEMFPAIGVEPSERGAPSSRPCGCRCRSHR